MMALFAIGGFGFGLLLAGGLIDDGLTAPLTAYWTGLFLLIASMVGCVSLAARYFGSLRGRQPD